MRLARVDLRLAHLPGAFVLLITLLAPGAPSEAAFSGPNGRIAFVSHRDGNDDVYTISGDGSLESKLTDSTEGDYGPAWSPDGSKIAFTSLRDGNEDVYVMNSDGSLETNCTKHSERDASVHWSADGTRIVFLSNRGNADVSDNDVYVMDLDDCGLPAPVPLALAANHPDREEEPVWSPDGSRIAYVHSTTFNDHRLFTMGPDGTGQAALPPDILPVNVTQPDWSPDAGKLAFTGTIPGEPQQIYTINTNGTGGLAQLTPSGASIMAGVRPATHATRRGGLVPAWSPDGTRIAFNREGDLVFVNPHGTDPVAVTGAAHSGHVSSPDWGTGAAPSASFAISPDRPLAGEIVSFDASASSDPDGGIARYEWDLDGDGSFETDTDQSPIASRFYPRVGTVTVGLRVADHDLNRSTATRPLTVETRRPSAFFAVSPNPAFAGQPITFDGSASRDPDGRIVRFEWDLDGDGGYEMDAGTSPIASRSYVSAATLSVKLRVTDNDGATSEGIGALGARALTIQWRRILAEATLTFLNTRNGIRVRSLVVRNVPSGSRVGISCRRGGRRACTHQAKSTLADRPHARAARSLSFPRLRLKRLMAGTLLEIRVTKRNQIGKYIRYTIRRGGFQKSEGCLKPGSSVPRRECG